MTRKCNGMYLRLVCGAQIAGIQRNTTHMIMAEVDAACVPDNLAAAVGGSTNADRGPGFKDSRWSCRGLGRSPAVAPGHSCTAWASQSQAAQSAGDGALGRQQQAILPGQARSSDWLRFVTSGRNHEPPPPGDCVSRRMPALLLTAHGSQLLLVPGLSVTNH